MKKSRSFLLSLFILFLPASGAAAAEEVLSDAERLDRGEVLSDGGYEGVNVWGRMTAVIKAPPAIVWQIFIESDSWNSYNIPRLIDSRFVDHGISIRVEKTRKAHDFYEALGDRRFALESYRKRGARWTHDAFQYYNVPWPVHNRWMVLTHLDDESLSHRGIYQSEWTRAAGNVNTITGTFRLSPHRGRSRETLLEYSVTTDPNAHVPKFLIKWGVSKAMPTVITAIRREAFRRWPPSRERPAVQRQSSSSSN